MAPFITLPCFDDDNWTIFIYLSNCVDRTASEVQVTGMDERGEMILEAALRVFLRHGVKRVTMRDIAMEAGIARQTLYNTHGGKDDIVRATTRVVAARALRGAEEGVAEAETLADRLDALFEHLAVRPQRMLRSSPNADDIVSGCTEIARRELEQAAARQAALIERVIRPHAAAIRAAGLTTGQLADYVQDSLAAIKTRSRSPKELRGRLESLRALLLCLTGQGTA